MSAFSATATKKRSIDLEFGKYEAPRFRFNGSNYGLRSIHFSSLLEGRGLWDLIDGTFPQPTARMKEFSNWRVKNGKIITWILDYVDTSIAVGLTPHHTAKDMRDHLKVVYLQSNEAHLYRLEQDLTQIAQRNCSMQEFYNCIMAIWTEVAMIDQFFSPMQWQSILRYVIRQRHVSFL